MSKPRRRKQKKQVKAELKLRQFAATELSDQLAALPCAADLPRFMVDTVAGAYAPADAELMIEGFAPRPHARSRCAPTRSRQPPRTSPRRSMPPASPTAPSHGTRTLPSCPRPRFPTCGTSTSTATARSTCKVCRP